MVEVFKTNVSSISQAREIVDLLLNHFPAFNINFDLEDCDNILRVEGDDILSGRIMQLVKTRNCICEVLE